MERPQILMIASLLGFVLMLAGFVGYVMSPSTAYEAVFILGLVVLAASYCLLSIGSRRTAAEFRSELNDEAVNGYVYYMVGGPADNDATITDLTRRRSPCPPSTPTSSTSCSTPPT